MNFVFVFVLDGKPAAEVTGSLISKLRICWACSDGSWWSQAPALGSRVLGGPLKGSWGLGPLMRLLPGLRCSRGRSRAALLNLLSPSSADSLHVRFPASPPPRHRVEVAHVPRGWGCLGSHSTPQFLDGRASGHTDRWCPFPKHWSGRSASGEVLGGESRECGRVLCLKE